MSFLKIDDPDKRDLIVKEYLETKKKIQDNQLAERTGEIELQSDLSRIFKPITEMQKAATKEITEGLVPNKEGLVPIKEGIEGLQKSIRLPGNIGIELNTTKEGRITMGKGNEMQIIGPIAYTYLMRFAEKTEPDKTFGLNW